MNSHDLIEQQKEARKNRVRTLFAWIGTFIAIVAVYGVAVPILVHRFW